MIEVFKTDCSIALALFNKFEWHLLKDFGKWQIVRYVNTKYKGRQIF